MTLSNILQFLRFIELSLYLYRNTYNVYPANSSLADLFFHLGPASWVNSTRWTEIKVTLDIKIVCLQAPAAHFSSSWPKNFMFGNNIDFRDKHS